MRFRVHVFMLLAVVAFLLGACSVSDGAPVVPNSHPTQTPSSPVSSSALSAGHNLLGYWMFYVDGDTIEAVPVRAADIHLNVLQFMEYGPCTNCLQITGFDKIEDNYFWDLHIDLQFTHPFPQQNLSGFDVRGIVMFEGDILFPELGLRAADNREDNAQLINADGHTTLYNPDTLGNGLSGYIAGKMTPPLTPNCTINGYKRFNSDTNRNYFLAGDSQTVEMVIKTPTMAFAFGYAVDASWAKPTQPVSVPDSFPPEANCPEAYQIDTELSNPLAINMGSTAILTIDVYDWQGVSTIDSVYVEAPYFWSGLKQATAEAGGPATQRYTLEMVNEYGAVNQGTWPILIQVNDTSSTPTQIIDNIGYKYVGIPVSTNHTPECSADVSTLDPDPGEDVTFTDTSTDADGASDLKESWWDWDNDGEFDEEGFEVTHSWPAVGTYEVNHKIIDMANAYDTLSEPIVIDVGLQITLQEDYDNKPIDVSYQYRYLDDSYSSGSIIDVEDTDGPWDFTTIGLNVGPNWMRILDDDDSEVASFVGDFNDATSHFVKWENMFDPFFSILYQAEYHHFSSDKLYIYGYHDPWVIGSSPFGPPDTTESLAIPYPLNMDTDYLFEINETGFVLKYGVKAVGEGNVTVPYDGGTTYNCLVVRYRFNVSAAEPVVGGTLNYAFISDTGIVVANVIAVNDPPEYNWNTSTDTINSNGNVLFQALHDIQYD